MASPIAPVIGYNGITITTFADKLDYLKAQYRDIHGADVYLENDSQDGQFLAVLAAALQDVDNALVDEYNSRSPSSAQGVALSSVIKINGIVRTAATYSTVDLDIVGVAGTIIANGQAADESHKWALPDTVTIPPGGSITVTATCTEPGAIVAMPNTITRINTPTRGWQTVNNASSASPGVAVESDADVRRKQKISTAIPAQTPMDGITGAVANVTGVTRLRGYENDTDSTDGNGIPSHSVCFVVEGGDASDIAQALAVSKSEGTGTYGDVTETVTTPLGNISTINFKRPMDKRTVITVDLTAKTGYTSDIGGLIRQSLADYINALGIGEDVEYAAMFAPAKLNNGQYSDTFKITALAIAFYPSSPGTSDLITGFDGVATCDVADITVNVS